VSGTLAWVASKPVSRGSIWLSKWFSATVMLAITAAIVPLVLTVAAVTVMYGAPDPVAVVVLAIGMTATVAFYAALGLAAGTVLPGQPAIAAVGFMVFALVPILVSLIPLPVGPFLPTSILQWSMATAAGQSVGLVTPLAWAIGTALVVAFALRRMSRMEL
jgi:ABC-type transport system involved in multi-copper enzyme maturation permease subunit